MLVKRNNLILPSLMNDMFAPDWFGGIENRRTVPAVNIRETETDFVLALAIPGFKKEDFNIELDNDVLTISSDTKEANDTAVNYTKREFMVSAFKRAFTLPETVDAEKINATYEAGILAVALPKKQEALPKPKRMIAIG